MSNRGGRASGDGSRQGTDYPERSPLDLIDEDKRPFARRRILATVLGGWRSTYDEVDETTIHWALFPIQILVYLLFPAVFYFIAGLDEKSYDNTLKSSISATIAFMIVALLQTISYLLEKLDQKK